MRRNARPCAALVRRARTVVVRATLKHQCLEVALVVDAHATSHIRSRREPDGADASTVAVTESTMADRLKNPSNELVVLAVKPIR